MKIQKRRYGRSSDVKTSSEPSRVYSDIQKIQVWRIQFWPIPWESGGSCRKSGGWNIGWPSRDGELSPVGYGLIPPGADRFHRKKKTHHGFSIDFPVGLLESPLFLWPMITESGGFCKGRWHLDGSKGSKPTFHKENSVFCGNIHGFL